ncbi:MAG: hypothetical protein HOV81_41735 [Kofleriaceae bacterium]|nr:hypothetical protein [Kofleriaceae bacterium]
MKTLPSVLASFAVCSGVAFADQPAEIEQPENQCPIVFRGAKVAQKPQKNGVTLEFTTSKKDNVEELRTQLREVAVMIEQHSTEMQTDASEKEDVSFPPVDLEVTNIDSGARVTIRAARFRDIPVVQELARSFTEDVWPTTDCVKNPMSGLSASTPRPTSRPGR